MSRTVILTVALAGCGWNHLPSGDYASFPGPLWDPLNTVATTDGLYVPLPATGQLTFLTPNGVASPISVRPGVVSELVAAPNPDQAVAFITRLGCPAHLGDACAFDEQEAQTEIALMEGGRVEQRVDVPGAYNRIGFSHDGTWALAWVDLSRPVQVTGLLSLSSVIALDLVTGASHTVGVGFAPDQVLFTGDDTRAVVLSRSEVALIDLLASPPQRDVTFPLTLDPDDVVVPVGVALTPDGQYALISAQGSSDLYVLDLDNPSINMVSLAGNPSAMAVDPLSDQTVFTFAGTSRVDVLEHQFFETASLALDEPMRRILMEDDTVILWDDASGHDAYRLDLETLQRVEYRLENPAVQMHLAPTHEFALALTRPEGGAASGSGGLYDQRPGLQVLDLRSDRGASVPYLLESQGIGAAFVASESSLTALILQEGLDSLFELELYTNALTPMRLSDPPRAIGVVPDGPFYITHDNGLGLVSFYDPDSGRLTEVAGFATFGILEDRPIPLEPSR